MNDRLAQLAAWMEGEENEHLEFKEAKGQFDFKELVKYCSALANERGGRIILGVSDTKPRRVVGSRAFENLPKVTNQLLTELQLRVDILELQHEDGRVLVFSVPSRPIGTPIQYKGAFLMRSGESLVPMTVDQLKRILDEGQPDFSAEINADLSMEDLDQVGLKMFRDLCIDRSGPSMLEGEDENGLLRWADLYSHGRGLTWASLILLGHCDGVDGKLPQAEVVYEYRSQAASTGFDERKEFRGGFLTFADELLEAVRCHNDVVEFDLGDEKRSVRSLNEVAVREAIVNAVAHRDYRLQGPIFVRQTPEQLEVSSPGGFPADVTPETILYCQSPRNRRLAETLVRCGFADRSGLGADRMFSTSVEEGKRPPDYSRTTANTVVVILHGVVRNPAFVGFLEGVNRESGHKFHIDDLVVLNAVHDGLEIPATARPRVTELIRIGALKRVEAERFVLARKFYEVDERPGEYTRHLGLDRETRKALLETHVLRCGATGAPLRDLSQVLPDEREGDLRNLIVELCGEGRLAETPSGKDRWVPGSRGDRETDIG